MKTLQSSNRIALLAGLVGALMIIGCGADPKSDGPDAAATVDTAVGVDTAVPVDTGAGADTAADTGKGEDAGQPTDAGAKSDTSAADAADASADTSGDTSADAGGIKEECNGVDDDKDGQTDEGACDDGDLCTADTCDPDNKQCSWKKIKEGESCDDGDACTQKERCKNNQCVATEATDCEDGVACTTDTCNKNIGICEHNPTPAGGACDDGDPCTEKDACQNGKCAGTALTCDDKDPCTTDACTPGKGCTTTPAADGGSCDDGQLCTKNDACKAGKCVGELPKDCASGDPCEVAACDPKTGACKKTVKKDGEACDDGDACSVGEKCTSGKCGGGKVTTCQPGQPCAPNVCDKKTGTCASAPIKDGGKCDDGNACTLKETCQGGKCLDIGKLCDDGNPCTIDSCDKLKGCKTSPKVGPCEDGNLCTTGEACKNGSCTGAKPKDCGDGTTCTVDSCNPADGTCAHNAKPQEGKPCNDDGSVCTANESCKAGKCQGGSAKVCKDGKPCTADTCDPKTGVCVFPPAKTGTACDDGSYCTFSDACDATGKCTGKTFPCDDKKPCTTDACVPSTGKCVFTPKKAGDLCDDGNLCTKGDTCNAAGTCVPGKATSCDDSNPCTNDACAPLTGKCINAANNNACNDGSVCTTGDACIAGKCQSGADGSASLWAGSGAYGYTNGSWNIARFGEPRGIAADDKGGFYVADRAYHRIRYISASRQVSTVAGSGSANYKDGPALSAYFRYPTGVAYAKGTKTLYVADSYNHCIRRLSAGYVNVVVGRCGSSSYYYGYANGAGSSARLYYPEDIAAAPDGTLIVVERGNHVVRRISGNSISFVAGTPKSGGFGDGKGSGVRFNSPSGVAVSDTGIIFVADSGNHRIRAIRPDGTVTTVAGGTGGFANGYKTSARFNYPYDVAWVKGGYLLVADTNNHRIRKVTLGGVVSTFSGTGSSGFTDGKATSARFYYPRSIVATASGDAYVSDTSNRRIRKVVSGVLSCVDSNPCTLDKCDAKKGCTFTKIPAGSACEDGATCQTGGTCDSSGSCTNTKPKCTDGGPCVTTTCDPVSGDCLFKPEGTSCNDGDPCTDGEGCVLGKCDATVWKVSTISGNGSATIKSGIGTSASHYYPRGMSHDASGNLYVASYNGHRIQRITPTRAVSTYAGSGSAGFQNGAANSARFYYPTDVAMHSTGALFVADRYNHRIRKIDASGNVTTHAGSGSGGFQDGPAASARFYYPEGVAVDSSGVVYVADNYNNRIRKISTNGQVTTFVGNGSSGVKDGTGTAASAYRPTAIAVGPNGTVYFNSASYHLIRKATPSGVVSLLAGSTSNAYLDGTGGGARFYYPSGLAVDSKGRVIVADRSNQRIRRIDVSGAVTTLAGNGSYGFTDGKATSARFYYPYGVTAIGETVFVGDTNNQRVRAIRPPNKDCDDLDPCTTDSCNAKTGVCGHQAIANCCRPMPYNETFTKSDVAKKMSFYSCTPDKFNVALKGCKLESDGVGPKKGWQVHTDAFASHSATGALYYGNGIAGNYNWGASAGKVVTAEMDVPKDKKTKLSFWVYFDTEAPQAFDKFYAWLWVDGKRVLLGSQASPNFGAIWYKGKPGYTTVKTWHKIEQDVSMYGGKKLRLEFTFNTGDQLKNFGVGAFVDDIALFTQCGK